MNPMVILWQSLILYVHTVKCVCDLDLFFKVTEYHIRGKDHVYYQTFKT